MFFYYGQKNTIVNLLWFDTFFQRDAGPTCEQSEANNGLLCFFLLHLVSIPAFSTTMLLFLCMNVIGLDF